MEQQQQQGSNSRNTGFYEIFNCNPRIIATPKSSTSVSNSSSSSSGSSDTAPIISNVCEETRLGFSGGCFSPSPSPVFMDEDSVDSGYSGGSSSQHGKYDDFDSISSSDCKRPKLSFARHQSFSTLKVCREEQEEDFRMEVDFDQLKPQQQDVTPTSNNNNKENERFGAQKKNFSPMFGDDSPFASLRLGTILRPNLSSNSSSSSSSSTTTKSTIEFSSSKPLRDSTNFGASVKCKKVVTMSTEENRFTLLKVPSTLQQQQQQQLSTTSHIFGRCRSESEIGILQAIQKADENRSLIGDFSDGHALPLLKNPKVPDLKCISGQTVSAILAKKYSTTIGHYALVDCRYPYEYQGGHIRSAVNIYTQEQLMRFLRRETQLKQTIDVDQNMNDDENGGKLRTVLMFYCEFSKERGPKMCRYLRHFDRLQNEFRYPCLDYPEIYLIEGGYKNFYAEFKDFCEPQSYKPMDHVDHAEDLRKFRLKSKSWSSFGAANNNNNSSTTTTVQQQITTTTVQKQHQPQKPCWPQVLPAAKTLQNFQFTTTKIVKSPKVKPPLFTTAETSPDENNFLIRKNSAADIFSGAIPKIDNYRFNSSSASSDNNFSLHGSKSYSNFGSSGRATSTFSTTTTVNGSGGDTPQKPAGSRRGLFKQVQ